MRTSILVDFAFGDNEDCADPWQLALTDLDKTINMSKRSQRGVPGSASYRQHLVGGTIEAYSEESRT